MVLMEHYLAWYDDMVPLASFWKPGPKHGNQRGMVLLMGHYVAMVSGSRSAPPANATGVDAHHNQLNSLCILTLRGSLYSVFSN